MKRTHFFYFEKITKKKYKKQIAKKIREFRELKREMYLRFMGRKKSLRFDPQKLEIIKRTPKTNVATICQFEGKTGRNNF